MSVRVASVLAVVVGTTTVIATAPATSSGSRTVARDASCASTVPNGRGPGIVTNGAVWARHGNGVLAAALRRDGTLVTNSLGGYKMVWFARNGVAQRLRVVYQRIDQASSPVMARTGLFGGYNVQPNAAMAMMSLEPGCWRVTGTLGKKPLTFVVQVVVGTG